MRGSQWSAISVTTPLKGALPISSRQDRLGPLIQLAHPEAPAVRREAEEDFNDQSSGLSF